MQAVSENPLHRQNVATEYGTAPCDETFKEFLLPMQFVGLPAALEKATAEADPQGQGGNTDLICLPALRLKMIRTSKDKCKKQQSNSYSHMQLQCMHYVSACCKQCVTSYIHKCQKFQ